MVNTLIGLYARRREVGRAFQLYQHLVQQEARGGQGSMAPNIFTYTNLLNAIAKAQHPPYDLGPEAAERAAGVFEEMLSRGIHPNQVAFHSLMDVQAKAALPDAAFDTYRAMLAAGVAPSHTTFSILMTACGRAGDHRRAAEVMEKLMPQAGVSPTTALWNSLLGAYAKSGSVDGAYATWVRMLESGAAPDAYTERALVDALASHPALAADVLAEARQIRQSMAQQQKHQPQQGQQRAGQVAGEAPEGPGAAARLPPRVTNPPGQNPPPGADVASKAAWRSKSAGAHQLSGTTPLRQGELLVDEMPSGTHSPLGGTTYQGTAYRRPTPAGSPGAQRGCVQAGEATLDLDHLLWLDLHRMSQAAARASLLRRLEVLVQLAPTLVQQVERGEGGRAAQRAQQGSRQRGRGPLAESLLGPAAPGGDGEDPPGLVVVTGVGRHSKEAGSGVLKEAVRDLLGRHGIPFEEDRTNAGRLLVPWPGLRRFVLDQQASMQAAHFWGAARARQTLGHSCCG